MFGDQHPRQFSYINHKDKYPLELKGNMKGKQVPRAKRADFSALGQGKADRQNLLKKIRQNYEDLKSIVPTDYKESKKESVKIMDRQKYIGMSGVPLLVVKSKQDTGLKQRKHITQNNLTQRFYEPVERRHYCKSHTCNPQQLEKPKLNESTHNMKVNADLHSSIYKNDKIRSSSVRRGERDMFRQGETLGYEQQKQKHLSKSKYEQIMGQYSREVPQQSRVVRDDWRRSSIVFS